MINPFFKNHGPFKIEQLLDLSDINNTKNYSKIKITDIKDLSTAKKNTITFLHSKKYESLSMKTEASFCITTESLSHLIAPNCKPIIVNKVLISTAQITKIFYPDAINDHFDQTAENIENSIFNKNVKYGKNVLIGKEVQIGKNCLIGHNSIIENNVIYK